MVSIHRKVCLSLLLNFGPFDLFYGLGIETILFIMRLESIILIYHCFLKYFCSLMRIEIAILQFTDGHVSFSPDYVRMSHSGGRDLSGNKRTNKEQSFDQKFEKSNAALKLSCRLGYPVRVVRLAVI